ncbi:hypothetical protein ACN2C7_14410 [Caulobacter sp. ErkDOM-E]|uniref:hypothetical protein n=1 Tax=Caulobacter sp. ErkDOM-E TaxID=3402778 RepID=UPI003AF44C5F
MAETQAGFKHGKSELAQDLLVRFGPTLLVDIGFKPIAITDNGPELEFRGLKALVDTGAGDSCIDSGIAGRARLPVIDQRVASGIGGATRVNIHMARLYIPSLKQMLFQPFAGVELETGGQWHQALLGRTFLRPYTLRYVGPTGEVVISHAD